MTSEEETHSGFKNISKFISHTAKPPKANKRGSVHIM
jgi:hypothetical protein